MSPGWMAGSLAAVQSGDEPPSRALLCAHRCKTRAAARSFLIGWPSGSCPRSRPPIGRAISWWRTGYRGAGRKTAAQQCSAAPGTGQGCCTTLSLPTWADASRSRSRGAGAGAEEQGSSEAVEKELDSPHGVKGGEVKMEWGEVGHVGHHHHHGHQHHGHHQAQGGRHQPPPDDLLHSMRWEKATCSIQPQI